MLVTIEGLGNINASETTFKTGSRGFRGCGKVQGNDVRYQVSINIVEIGSKPKEVKPAPKK